MKKVILILGICIMFILSMNLSYGALTDNLLAYWTGDIDGSFDDSTINNHNGTIEGATYTASGFINGSYDYDGSNDYISIPESDDWGFEDKNFSISLWVKHETVDLEGNPFMGTGLGGSNLKWWFSYEGGTGVVGSDLYVFFYQNPAGTNSDTSWATSAPSTGAWYHLVYTRNGTDANYYINGTRQGGIGDPTAIPDSDQILRIGSDGEGYMWFDGILDEIGIWDRQLSQTEIDLLFNSGVGLQYPFGAPKEIDLLLFDRNFNVVSAIDEGDKIYIGANYTESSLFVPGATCNFTARNITYVKDLDIGNFTLSDSTSQLEILLDEKNDSIFNDAFLYDICRIKDKIDNQIYINGTLYKTIDKETIPKCQDGSLRVLNLTTDFNNVSVLNFTLKCNACDGNNKQLKIVESVRFDTLNWFRVFNTHTEDLTENVTDEYYIYNEHLYLFGQQEAEINITCDGTIETFNFNISDVNLTIEILDINDIPFTSGLIVEANDSYMININVFGDVITFLQTNITYPDGTLIQSYNNTFSINLTHSLFNDSGILNISIVAIDDELNPTLLKDYFIVNDTVNPIITWDTPLDDGSTSFDVNVSQTLDLTFSDVNLFAYEVLIYDPSSVLIRNYSDTDLQVTSVNLLESITFNETGIYSINVSVSDDHTIRQIPDYDYSVNDTKIDFNFELVRDYVRQDQQVNIEYIGLRDVEIINLVKFDDRYSFEYVFDVRSTTLFNDKYIVTCQNIIFRHNSPYIAHFVCPETNNWIDFEADNINRFFVQQLSNDSYEIELELIDNDLTSMQFNSIGGINIINESTIFEVVLPSETPIDLLFIENFDIDNISHTFLLGILIIFYLVCMIMSLVFKSLLFRIFAVIIGMFISAILMTIIPLLGISIMIINLATLLIK